MADEEHQVRRPALNKAQSTTSNWSDERSLAFLKENSQDFILLCINLFL